MKEKIPADAVRNGVGELEVLERSGRDLVVVVRVTPRSKSLDLIVRKQRCVVNIRGI